MKKRLTGIILAATVLLAYVERPSFATLIYDNGATTFHYGLEVARYQLADDFFTNEQAVLTGARFWTTEGEGIRAGAVPFDGHIDYWFYTSDEDAPSSEALVSGVADSITRTDLGVHDHWYGRMHRYEYEISFSQPLSVEPGVEYFFSLHLLESYPYPNGEIYWSTADGPNLGASSHSRNSGTGAWTDVSTTIPGVYGADRLAFQLIGLIVPEPDTMCYAVSAFFVTAWIRRRQTPSSGVHNR